MPQQESVHRCRSRFYLSIGIYIQDVRACMNTACGIAVIIITISEDRMPLAGSGETS